MFELLVAFGAGLISFLSPCVLPLIPGYISYITGNSLSELIEKKKVNLTPIILFTVGFSIVFILFGAAATFIGQLFLSYSNELRIAAGIIIIIFLIIYNQVLKDSESWKFIGLSKSNTITLDVQEKIFTKYPQNIPEWIIDNYDNLLTTCVNK